MQITDRQAGSNTGGESLIDRKDASAHPGWRPLGTATASLSPEFVITPLDMGL
jgi:hypothetical protein